MTNQPVFGKRGTTTAWCLLVWRAELSYSIFRSSYLLQYLTVISPNSRNSYSLRAFVLQVSHRRRFASARPTSSPPGSGCPAPATRRRRLLNRRTHPHTHVVLRNRKFGFIRWCGRGAGEGRHRRCLTLLALHWLRAGRRSVVNNRLVCAYRIIMVGFWSGGLAACSEGDGEWLVDATEWGPCLVHSLVIVACRILHCVLARGRRLPTSTVAAMYVSSSSLGLATIANLEQSQFSIEPLGATVPLISFESTFSAERALLTTVPTTRLNT